MSILDAARRKASDELVKRVRVVDLLRSLLDEELWVPVLPLVYDRLEDASTYTLCEAARRSSYFEVLYEFLALIYSLVKLYGSRHTHGDSQVNDATCSSSSGMEAIVPNTSL